MSPWANSGRRLRQILPPLVTLAVFALIFQRVQFSRFLAALRDADPVPFAALMLANGLLYFVWDTLVLVVAMRWFHGPIRYGELLPVRSVTYLISFLNTNLARAATAFYLKRKLNTTFFPIAGTVIFLTLMEMAQLVVWATAGMVLSPLAIPRYLFAVPFVFLAGWLAIVFWGQARNSSRGHAEPQPFSWRRVADWPIFQTFLRAPARRYIQVILLRAPLFAASLCLHYFALQTFGIEIPLLRLVAYLPIIFMLAALPITVAHLGTTQAAWIFFFGDLAPAPHLLAYSLASHLAFMFARAGVGLVFLPRAYRDLFGPLDWRGLFTEEQPISRPADS